METSYFLSQETRCTTVDSGRTTVVIVPKGSLLSVIGPAPDAPHFVEIRWQDRTVRMFSADFSERASAASPASGDITPASSTLPPAPPLKLPAIRDSQGRDSQVQVKVRRFNAAGRELT